MASQQTVAAAAESLSSTLEETERNRYKSPPPPPSSMTPPPSSQAPALPTTHIRTPSPRPAHLSSPPPTIKSSQTSNQISHPTLENQTGMFSSDQIAIATPSDLRTMLSESMTACREARAAAAHHNLQYTLLRMETSEAIKRMEVEIEMKAKEVDVLQAPRKGGSNSAFATPVLSNQGAPRSASPNDRVVLDLKNACQLLEIENENLRRRLSDAKAALIEREDSLMEENDRLRERIRENRSHMALFRQAMPETPTAAALSTPYVTPAQTVVNTSKHTPGRQTIPSTPKQRGDQTFAALLLADRVLSQGAGETQSSTSRAAKPRARKSSPPTTPTPISKAYGPYYVNTPRAQPRLQSPPLDLQTTAQRANEHRRRESRDSTISASDIDERHDLLPDAQTATVAKSRPSGPRRGNVVPVTPTKQTPAVGKFGAPTPTRGYASPSGVAQNDRLKRKQNADADVPATGVRASKRGRMSEGVGLGIGGLYGT